MLEGQSAEVPQNLEQVDQLLNQIEAPEPEVAQAATETQAPQTEQAAPSPEAEYELVFRGKKETLPISKVITFAQQGRDYAEKMREYNQTRHQFEAEKASWQKQAEARQKEYEQYAQVDEFARTNPEQWAKVLQAIQQPGQQAGYQIPPQLLQEISELKQFVNQTKEEKQRLQMEQEDKSLNQDISGYREKHPDFDWDTLDPQTNQTLEQRIIQHAIDNGIKSFKAAANDYLFDEHVKRASLKAKEDVGKTIQEQTKKGMGPKSPVPIEKMSKVKDVRNKSWNQIQDEVLAELGLA